MTPSAHHTRRDTPTHSTRTTYERLINLVLALKDSTRPLRGRWIIEHVSGYGDVPEESRLRKLTRDIAQLRDLGFVITAVEDGYLIDFSHTIDVHFTREEMEVIALASKFALSGDLAVLGQRAWVKLSAAGSLGTVAPVHGVPDGTDLTGPDFSTVLHAITTGTVVQFLYYPSVEDEPVQRTVEPWALVPHNGRWYLTCFDLERNEPRSFRLARINSIDDTGVAASHIAHRVNTDLKELVSSVVNRETIAHETRSSVRSRLDSLRAGITDSSTWILPTSMPKLEDTDHSVDECDIPSVSHQHHTELLRLFTIVPYLRQHSGVTLFEAAHDLAMSPRQLKNDITTLTFCGLPGLAGGDLIDIDADPRHIFLWADQGLTAPVGLTMEEASAILMALGTIDSISGIVDSDTIRRAEYKLRKMAGHHADATSR